MWCTQSRRQISFGDADSHSLKKNADFHRIVSHISTNPYWKYCENRCKTNLVEIRVKKPPHKLNKQSVLYVGYAGGYVGSFDLFDAV